MKILLVFTPLLFLLNLVVAQTSTPGITQKVIGGDTLLIHIPIGYTTGQKVNVMIGAPGDGESDGPIAKDTTNGSFATWAGKPGIRDTTSNATLDPNLIICWWNPGTTIPGMPMMQTLITALEDTFNVNKVAVMGLSLGCQDWTNFAWNSRSNFNQIAGFFLCSPEPANNPAQAYFGGGLIPGQWFADDSTYIHIACATADPDGFWPNAHAIYDSVLIYNVYTPRLPIIDSLTCACHSSTAWGPMFSPYVNQTKTGMSIYKEFMTQFPITSATAATPTFSPVAGPYVTSQTVTISTTTPGATIHYTIDGSAPTTASTVYSTPISVSITETVKAMDTASGFINSGVGSALYTINATVATPTFSPVAGAYGSSQSVTISTTTPSATIYYTVDGSTPTTGSTLYSGAITVAASKTIKALAVLSGYNNSSVGSASYTITGAVNYYFSNGGTDGNPGTQISPMATITKLNTLTLVAGDSIFFNQGNSFTGTIYAKSGVYYGSYGLGAKPIINGFTTLSGWTSMGGNIYESLCSGCTVKTNLVVLDGVIQKMGSWPDTGYRTYTGISTTSITDASLSSSPYNWTGGYAAVRDEFYIIDTASIASQSGGLVFNSNLSNTGTRGNGYFIFNDSRTLLLTSRVGSWYCKSSADSVQMYFGSGGAGGHTVKVSTHDTLFYANSISNVTVNGLDFEGSNLYSIFDNNTSNMVYKNCDINFGGGNGILANNCPGTTFSADSISNFNNNGAYITGTSSTNNIISNNVITNIGLIPGMGHGSGNGTAGYTGWSNLTGFNTYFGNVFKYIGYIGIAFSGDSTNIYNNYVDSFCMVKADGGGIYTTDASFQTYTYGRNIFNNVILYGQAAPSGIVYNASDMSFGIYCDGHSTSVTISGNTTAFNASGGMLIHGSTITVSHNHIFGNLNGQVLVQQTSGITLTSLIFKNNIICSSGQGSQFLMYFTTPSTNLASLGTVDSNTYIGYNSNNATPFFTLSSTDGGTNRSLSGWTSNLSYDTHSTIQNGLNNLFFNSISSPTRTILPGLFQDKNGNIFTGTLYLSSYSSIILLLQNSGFLAIPYGLTLKSSN